MTSREEALRALEKAVDLVAKATPGTWGVDEYGDVQANGEDVARIATGDDHAAADAEIVAAAVNFIREHGSALIAELGQEVGRVPNGKLVGWWNGITPGFDGMGVPSVRWGADAENSHHDIPLYDGYNPIHYVTPQRDSVLQGVRELAIKAAAHWDADEDMKVGKILMALAGQLPKYDKRADAFDAALEASP